MKNSFIIIIIIIKPAIRTNKFKLFSGKNRLTQKILCFILWKVRWMWSSEWVRAGGREEKSESNFVSDVQHSRELNTTKNKEKKTGFHDHSTASKCIQNICFRSHHHQNHRIVIVNDSRNITTTIRILSDLKFNKHLLRELLIDIYYLNLCKEKVNNNDDDRETLNFQEEFTEIPMRERSGRRAQKKKIHIIGLLVVFCIFIENWNKTSTKKKRRTRRKHSKLQSQKA